MTEVPDPRGLVRGEDIWRGEGPVGHLPLILLGAVIVPLSGFFVRGAWFLIFAAPPPDPAIAAIFAAAAERGVYVVDGVTGAQNMAEPEQGAQLLTTTARRAGAVPQDVALTGSAGECTLLARELASMRDGLGFCTPRG